MTKVRQFLPKDFERISQITKDSFPYPWSESYLRRTSQKRAGEILIAETAGKTVGYILGYVKHNYCGSVKILAVDPDFRKQGIGRKLIEAIIEKLKKEGAQKIFLKLRAKNTVAENFYEQLGFKKSRILKKYFSNGDDAYLMKKNI